MKNLELTVGKRVLADIVNGTMKEFAVEVTPKNVVDLIELDEEGYEREDKYGNAVPIPYDRILFKFKRKNGTETALVTVYRCETEMFIDEQGEPITFIHDERVWVAEQVVYMLGEVLETSCTPVEKENTPSGPVMKTLAIRQPWATLIALGIKDVENRNAMRTKCQKIFVTASMTKEPWDSLPSEAQRIITRCQQVGLMPSYDKLPTKCIVGYVDIVETTFGHVDSRWAAEDGIKYVLRNAHELDEPIYGKCKATPYFYNVEGYDEEHLPAAHVADLSLLED